MGSWTKLVHPKTRRKGKNSNIKIKTLKGNSSTKERREKVIVKVSSSHEGIKPYSEGHLF